MLRARTHRWIEAGLDSVAAPGLAYALYRGGERLELTLDAEGRQASFDLPVATLDATLVMKALLVAEGTRHQLDRLVTDTADAAMLAVSVARSPEAVDAISENRGRREVRRALRWLGEAFTDQRSAAARRVQRHFEQEYERDDGSAWAVEHVAGLLDAVGGRRRA
ncbi:MAG TPA: hypothetical protein VKB25_11130 [Conexibacter sp.]|nr:hypothetical protein [Conexibacter sp.]